MAKLSSVELQKLMMELSVNESPVELVTLNLERRTGPKVFFTAGKDKTTGVVEWRGDVYTQILYEITGLQSNSDNKPATPTIRIQNNTNILSAYMAKYNQLLKMPISIQCTFERFLDGKPDANPNAIWSSYEFFVSQTVVNKQGVELSLESRLTINKNVFPKEVLLRDGGVFGSYPGIGTSRI